MLNVSLYQYILFSLFAYITIATLYAALLCFHVLNVNYIMFPIFVSTMLKFLYLVCVVLHSFYFVCVRVIFILCVIVF